MVGIPDEQQVSLGYVLKYWNWSAEEIVALVEAVRRGSVIPQSLLDNTRGVSRWVFDVSQLRAFQRGLNSGRSNWVSIPEMASLLGIKQQVAYWLTHHGFIRAERLGSQKGVGSRVRREDVELFGQQYVFGRDIAAMLGRSPRTLSKMLAAQGIHPLRGYGTQPCRQLFYARSDELQNFLSQVTGSPPGAFKLLPCLGASDHGT